MPFISGKKYIWNLGSFDDGSKMGEEWDRLHDNTDDLNTRATNLETRATNLEKRGYDDTDTTADLAITGLPDNGPWLVTVQGFVDSLTANNSIIRIREGGVGGSVKGELVSGSSYLYGMAHAIISGTSFYIQISTSGGGSAPNRKLVTWQRFVDVV